MLQIEVRTSKRTLTKSLLKQIRWPSIEELGTAKVIGFIYNVENPGKLFLLKTPGGYRKIPHGWIAGTGESDVTIPTGMIVLKSREERDEFLNLMDKIEILAEQLYV